MRFGMLLLLAFASACGGRTPSMPDVASLQFTTRVAGPEAAESITADAGSGRIAVRAIVSGPDPCRTLEGQLDRTDVELTLRVSIQASGSGGCAQVISHFAYEAVIDRLPRGRYVFTVVHTYPSTGWPTQVAFTQTMDVR
jgi:hypothetical protein